MARFFKYKTLEELQADAAARGLDVPLSKDFSPLAEPIAIGPLRAGNRLAIQPMEGCDGTLEGHPDELTFRRYRRFGAGGAKIIWGEATAVVEEGRANTRQLWINQRTAGSLERLLGVCRDAHRETSESDDDLIVGLQLTHSGRYSYARPLPAFHDPLLDPLTVVDRASGKRMDESYPLFTDDDLKRLEDDYVAAARLALRSGFDFVDLKQCHGYLLNELLAAKTRPGPYGGSFENRTRLVRNVVTRIRADVPGAVVCTRMSAFDALPFRSKPETGVGEPVPFRVPVTSAFGTDEQDPASEDLTEPLALVELLKGLGVEMFNVSMGNPYASPHVTRPFDYPPVDGYQTPEHPLEGVARHMRIAAAIQRAHPDVVVVGSGYSWLQSFLFHAAAANVAAGNVQIAGVGRAALPYPDFTRAMFEKGRLEPQRVCRTFSYCTALMRSKHNELGQFPTGCPPFDKEVYGPIWKEAEAGDSNKDDKTASE